MHRRALSVLAFLVGHGCTNISAAPAASASPLEVFRGGKVEWGRLITRSGYWDRHSKGDAHMLNLMREHSSLNIGREWRTANPSRLEELCRHPFLYADNIALLTPEQAGNLAEYLRRGGFLFIDCCTNSRINPDPHRFLRGQIEVLKAHFTDAQIAAIKPEHEVFSIHFKMVDFPPQTRQGGWTAGAAMPLHVVLAGERAIAIISLNGFQCGWADPEKFSNAVESMKMAVNIYIYAMTR